MADLNPIVAIVDDDELVRRALRRLVVSLAFRASEFASGEAFLESLVESVPSCVLLDLHMPGLNGLEVLARMRAQNLHVPTIIITGTAQPEMRGQCIEAGAAAYLPKPLDPEIVFSTIRSVTS
jgi:FixJ family two-component response regulator